jgi:hypothetical protein
MEISPVGCGLGTDFTAILPQMPGMFHFIALRLRLFAGVGSPVVHGCTAGFNGNYTGKSAALLPQALSLMRRGTNCFSC